MRRSFVEIFLLVFPSTAIVFGGLLYFTMGLGDAGLNGVLTALSLGAACGGVFGVGIGYFARGGMIDFDVDPAMDIHTRMQLALLDMGYRIDNQYQRIILFQPTMRAGLFADRIRVELKTGHVQVEGPHYHLDKLRRSLGV